MLKIACICGALILAAAAFSTSAEAQRGGGVGARVSGGGGAHFGGVRAGGFRGARVGGARFSGARIGSAPFRGARVATGSIGGRYYGHGAGRGWRGGVYRGGRYAYGYRHRGYWPYWGWGVAASVAALGWPYDYGYDYGDYVYEEAIDDSAIAYCMRRFRSYDPASGTYLGYDGRRHPCP